MQMENRERIQTLASDLEGMPCGLSWVGQDEAGAENSHEALREKWMMEVIGHPQEEDSFYWQPRSWYD